MKKLFILISSTLALFACTKNDSSTLEDVRLNPNQPQKKTGKPLSAGDGKWDLLGYGYDVTGQFANSESATWPIIDIDSLKKYHPTYVDESGAETGTHFFESGFNSYDFSKKMTKKVNLGITASDSAQFKGSINSNFNNEDKWSSKYMYATYSTLAVKKRVKVFKDLAILKNYLHSGFLNHVQSLTPQQLVSAYGTHVLIDIKLGGKLELIYQAQTNSQNRTTAASSGAKLSFLKIFSINTEGETNQSEASLNFNEKAFVRTVGGNSGAAIVNTVTFNNNGTPSFTFNPTGWAAGVTDENAEMIDISYDGLIPIYELIDDPIKKSALQSYILQYLSERQVKLTSDIIYLFYNPIRKDYALHNDLGTASVGASWYLEGQTFKAFLSQAPGTVPIYQFRNDTQGGDHHYSTIPVLNYPGWQYEGVIFYAYKTQVAGSIPVYQFYNGNNTCHLYAPDINAVNGFPGWVYEGISFYALPL